MTTIIRNKAEGTEYHVTELSWMDNGAVAIVAVMNTDVGDWAAYIGCAPYETKAAAVVDQVVRFGNKISEEHARALFPEIGGDWRD